MRVSGKVIATTLAVSRALFLRHPEAAERSEALEGLTATDLGLPEIGNIGCANRQ
jgi:hypothetical protein